MEPDLSQIMLPCSKCGDTKPATKFAKQERCVGRYGRHSWCMDCIVNDNKRRYAAEPERHREMARKHSRTKRLKMYGLDRDSYSALLAAQNGVCGICGKPDEIANANSREMAVDHDHRTGQVRGLLCFMCNTAIGKLRDDPDLIRKAARYLERFQEAHQPSLLGDA